MFIEVLLLIKHVTYTTWLLFCVYFQLSRRGQMVEFLCFVTEQLKLSVVTTHLAVYLLDRFMDGHHINDNQLKLTALTAILVAGRYQYITII